MGNIQTDDICPEILSTGKAKIFVLTTKYKTENRVSQGYFFFYAVAIAFYKYLY